MCTLPYTGVSCGDGKRRAGKQKATAYAAKEVQGGMAVTNPSCNDDLSTMPMMQRQTAAKASVSKMYLRYSQYRKKSAVELPYKFPRATRRVCKERYVRTMQLQIAKTLYKS
jgi:hypothetical protein